MTSDWTTIAAMTIAGALAGCALGLIHIIGIQTERRQAEIRREQDMRSEFNRGWQQATIEALDRRTAPREYLPGDATNAPP